MKISKRLIKISEYIDKDSIVFDVGSDHALLPCYLIENNLVRHVYAGDNKKGPLAKASENISKYGLSKSITTILSSGLNMVSDDVDTVVIAGMGAYTALDILTRANLSQFKKIIVQVNKDLSLIRKFISDNHYHIIDETVIYDDFFYEVIVFNTEFGESLNLDEINYGPVLLAKKDLDFIAYLKFQLTKLKEIVKINPSEALILKINEINRILK